MLCEHLGHLLREFHKYPRSNPQPKWENMQLECGSSCLENQETIVPGMDGNLPVGVLQVQSHESRPLMEMELDVGDWHHLEPKGLNKLVQVAEVYNLRVLGRILLGNHKVAGEKESPRDWFDHLRVQKAANPYHDRHRD